MIRIRRIDVIRNREIHSSTGLDNKIFVRTVQGYFLRHDIRPAVISRNDDLRLEHLDPPIVVPPFGQAHRPAARIIRPGQIHGVQSPFQALAHQGQGLQIGIHLILFTVPIHIHRIRGAVPDHPRFRRQHFFIRIARGIQFVPHQIIVCPCRGNETPLHIAVTIDMVRDIQIQGIDSRHQLRISNQTVIKFMHRRRAGVLQTLHHRTGITG